MWTCWKALFLTLSDVMINCNCFNDWDYSLLVPNEVFEPYLILWIAYYLNTGDHMTKSIYVAVIRMIMMPSCPYFIFIDTSISKTCGHIFRYRLPLENKQVLSLGELIRPLCIMLLYRYLLHYGLLLHVMSQYLWLFSLILQGLTWRGRMPAAGILGWKRSKYWRPILHSSKSPETPRKLFWELIKNIQWKKYLRGATHRPWGWGRAHPYRAPHCLVGPLVALRCPSSAIWSLSSEEKS